MTHPPAPNAADAGGPDWSVAEQARVQGMDWSALQVISGSLRKLTHDLNNAMVPVFGTADILRLRHAQSPVAEDLDKLASRLMGVRETVVRAANHTLRHRHAQMPSLRTVHGELAGEALGARVGLRWQSVAPLQGALPGLDGHEACLLMRALVLNAFEAHTEDPPGGPARLTAAGERRQVWVDMAPTDGGVRVTVRDNGPGCTDLAAASVGQLRRRGWGHLGLGLQVAASLAQRTGGSLYIHNLHGAGFMALATLVTSAEPPEEFRPPGA